MTLQYGLKDSPCSTEWIDVHQQICLITMEPFHRLCVPSKKLEKADSNASTNAWLHKHIKQSLSA